MDSLQHHSPYATSISEVCGYTGLVKAVNVEQQHFRGVENYFTVVILYKDEQEGETNERNEADA